MLKKNNLNDLFKTPSTTKFILLQQTMKSPSCQIKPNISYIHLLDETLDLENEDNDKILLIKSGPL